MSLTLLYGLSALLHLYLALRLLPALPAAWAAGLLAALLVLSAVAMPLGLVARRFARGPRADRLALAGLVFMGLFSSLFVLGLGRDALLALAWVAGRLAGRTWPSQALVQASAAAVPLLALALTALGYWNARRTARVVTVDLPVAGLPEGLHGFRIAQISDIHVGPTIKQPYLDGIVDAVNALQADLVAITGDLVDGTVADLAPHVAPLARLRSREGSFFVTGNHEYYSGAAPWLAELGRLRVRTLLNEHVLIKREGATLVLAGVADWSAHHFEPSHKSDPAAALRGAPPEAALRVLLAHQPRTATAAADAGFDLQLSGHTHGGQFLPWNLFVPLQQPFTAGLHSLGRLRVYVSRGTGYWGPPKRLGAPSEITLLRLVPA